MVSSVSTPQHLVVIRGNSGSGKTTLARDLQLAMGRGTANILGTESRVHRAESRTGFQLLERVLPQPGVQAGRLSLLENPHHPLQAVESRIVV